MLVWAHGLWGSPNGSKITAIKNSGIEVVAPNFNEMELIDRITLIEEVIDEGNIVLAGSSWGGLACALAAQQNLIKLKAYCSSLQLYIILSTLMIILKS